MEPSRDTHATLVDLLDRILDKGLVINADIIISVAGIPLLGVNLRAALAGMETMLKYGVMQAWDEKTRLWESEHRKNIIPFLVDSEEIILKMYGSYDYNKGIYHAWRPGYFYLTDTRLILYRQDFGEITFQISLDKIKALAVIEEKHFGKDQRKKVLYLIDKLDQVHRLSASDTNELKDAIEQKLVSMGLTPDINPLLPEIDEGPIDFLTGNEEITHRGRKIWYLVPSSGIHQETWRPGHLYLTNMKLCWWYDFERKLVIDIPVDTIVSATTDIRKISGLDSQKEKVLEVVYRKNSEMATASFSGGDQLDEWAEELNRIISPAINEVTLEGKVIAV